MVKRKINITGIKARRKMSNIEIYNKKIKKLRTIDKGLLKGNARSNFA